jgi:hypothetical protein
MNSNATSAVHTAGPWIVTNHNEICAENDRESFIAEVFDETDEWRANARLIAAAPEFLAALDVLLRCTVDMDLAYGITLTEGEDEARRQALAAIEKACG